MWPHHSFFYRYHFRSIDAESPFRPDLSFKGPCSSVHRVRDKLTGDQLCLKVYSKSGLSEPQLQQVFREAEIHGRMNHPYVLQFLAAWEDNTHLFLLLEFAPAVNPPPPPPVVVVPGYSHNVYLQPVVLVGCTCVVLLVSLVCLGLHCRATCTRHCSRMEASFQSYQWFGLCCSRCCLPWATFTAW